MTLEELYQETGGNYQEIMERLRTEERIRKFVLLFLKDTSYQTFLHGLEQGNTQEAFRAVHTLKGVCMNLSFDSLYQISSEITEFLREGNLGRAAQLLPELDKCYKKHCHAISRYEEGHI